MRKIAQPIFISFLNIFLKINHATSSKYVSVLLSASVKRVGVSRVRDFFLYMITFPGPKTNYKEWALTLSWDKTWPYLCSIKVSGYNWTFVHQLCFKSSYKYFKKVLKGSFLEIACKKIQINLLTSNFRSEYF